MPRLPSWKHIEFYPIKIWPSTNCRQTLAQHKSPKYLILASPSFGLLLHLDYLLTLLFSPAFCLNSNITFIHHFFIFADWPWSKYSSPLAQIVRLSVATLIADTVLSDGLHYTKTVWALLCQSIVKNIVVHPDQGKINIVLKPRSFYIFFRAQYDVIPYTDRDTLLAMTRHCLSYQNCDGSSLGITGWITSCIHKLARPKWTTFACHRNTRCQDPKWEAC